MNDIMNKKLIKEMNEMNKKILSERNMRMAIANVNIQINFKHLRF